MRCAGLTVEESFVPPDSSTDVSSTVVVVVVRFSVLIFFTLNLLE
jgi:hypothetical protein